MPLLRQTRAGRQSDGNGRRTPEQRATERCCRRRWAQPRARQVAHQSGHSSQQAKEDLAPMRVFLALAAPGASCTPVRLWRRPAGWRGRPSAAGTAGLGCGCLKLRASLAAAATGHAAPQQKARRAGTADRGCGCCRLGASQAAMAARRTAPQRMATAAAAASRPKKTLRSLRQVARNCTADQPPGSVTAPAQHSTRTACPGRLAALCLPGSWLG